MNPVIPTAADCMTPTPHVVAPGEKLSRARSLMEDYGIRHLPVMRHGKLVGIVSDRDMNMVFTLAHAPPDAITVEDAMSADPYVVEAQAPLQQVARTMAERKLGSAVVVDHGEVIGLVTTTDALHALADSLEGKDVRRTYESVPTRPPAGRRAGERDLP